MYCILHTPARESMRTIRTEETRLHMQSVGRMDAISRDTISEKVNFLCSNEHSSTFGCAYSSNFCNEDIRQNLHNMPSNSFLQEVLHMTQAQQYNICTKQSSVLNWRQLSRPADAPSWDSNPVLVAGKCHVCINPEQETKILFFKLVFTCYDEYLIWQSVEIFCDRRNRN